MKTLVKKTLSILLCIVMVISTASVAFAADSKLTYGTKYFLSTTDAKNADAVLDAADEILAKANIYKSVDLGVATIEVDLRSINGLCDTLDLIKSLWGIVGTTAVVGDLSDLNFDVWKKGMKRGSQDTEIINELLEFLGTTTKKVTIIKADKTNAEIIASILDADAKLGVLGNFIDLEDMLGKDGVRGIIKNMLVKWVYAEGSSQYNTAYAKTLDNFVYEDLVPAKISNSNGILPGFNMNSSSTVDNLLVALLSSAWSKYLVPAIKGVNENWMKDENGNIKESLKDLTKVMNFNGASFDETSVTIDTSKTFASQINNIVGVVAKFFVPGVTWTDGDYTYLSSNINNLYLYLANELGITTSSTSSEAVTLEVVKYIVSRLDNESFADYASGVASCKTVQEAFALVLKNAATINNIPVTSSASATYENILGDLLVYFIGDYVTLDYEAGSGKNVWDVVNDVVNVFMFDKGFAKALNISISKTDSIFTKLDKIIAMTKVFDGLTPAENYKTENFLKGLIDALFSLDLAEAADMTAVRFLGDFGEKNAVKVVYDVVYNTLSAFFGSEIIVPYSSSNPLDNAISDSSLESTVANLLTQLNSRKSAIVPPVLFLGAMIVNSASAQISVIPDQAYTGKEVTPSVTVKIDGTTLKENTDYTVSYSDNTNFGTATATVTGKDRFTGSVSTTFNIVLGDVSNLKAASGTNKVTLSWNAVPGAENYTVNVNGKTIKTTTNSCTADGLDSGKEYKCTVVANRASASSNAASLVFATAPAKVTGVKATASANSVALSWSKAANATSYIVEKSTDGKTWAKVSEVTTTSCTASSLESAVTYKFRVKAVAKTASASASGEYSDVYTASTVPDAVQGLKAASGTTSSVSLTWTAVSRASSYTVAYSTDGKTWKTVNTSSNKATVSSLKTGTAYQFKVCAYSKSANTTGAYSSVLKVTTAPAKVTGLKISSVTAASAKLTWIKAAGATKYVVSYSLDGKKWTSKTVNTNSITVTGLTALKSYSFKVQAVSSFAGEYSAVVKATTLPAKVTGLKASSATSSQIKITWTKVSGASSYTVSYSADGKKWTNKTVTANSFTLKKLKANKTYQFKVKAYSKTTKTYGEFSSVLKASTAPAKVTGLKVSAVTSTTVKLTWKKATGANSYTVAYSTDGKKWKTVTSKKNSATVTKLTANKKYYFKVMAVNGVAKSDYSSTVNTTTHIAAPASLKAATVTKNSVKLSWKKVSGASGYEVYRLSGNKWKKVATIKKGSTTTYTDSNLSRSTTYKYKVRAYKVVSKKNVYGDYSSELSARTKLF